MGLGAWHPVGISLCSMSFGMRGMAALGSLRRARSRCMVLGAWLPALPCVPVYSAVPTHAVAVSPNGLPLLFGCLGSGWVAGGLVLCMAPFTPLDPLISALHAIR